MPEKPWKRAERMVAHQVRGKRTIAGGPSAPDVISDTLRLEVMLRKELPRWIVEGVEKARRHTTQYKLGGLVMVDGGTGDKYLVLSLPDYLDWYGK